MLNKLLAAGAAAAILLSAPVAQAQEKLRIGVMATLTGVLTTLGEDGVRGLEIARRERGGRVLGREIEYIITPTDASPDSALRAARKLVEQDRVELIIGPLSGSEGIAMRDYSRSVPHVTFINGSSGAMETTWVNPSPNFFRFNMDGSQWMAGLGKYIFEMKKYRRIVALAEDYSFPYTQLFGFSLEYCGLGGQITERIWVPFGTKDFASVIAKLPDDVDAIFLGLGGGDAINFLNQYQQAGGKLPLIGGSIFTDQTILSSRGTARRALIGTPSAGPNPDTWDNPRWQAWVKRYQDAFPPNQRFGSPSLSGTGYYNSANALFDALIAVNGDLSNNHEKLRATLASMVLQAPNGEIRLDGNRQAIGTNFVTEVIEQGDVLTTRVVAITPNVAQTLGRTPEAFRAIGLPSRTNPACTR
jgi:ABC-type branched-subunit amino acid transport system substrate-binding protein